MTASVETTRTARGTDRLGVYLVHWPDRQTSFEQTIRGLEELARLGTTRFGGVSSFKATAIAGRCPPARLTPGAGGISLPRPARHRFDSRSLFQPKEKP